MHTKHNNTFFVTPLCVFVVKPGSCPVVARDPASDCRDDCSLDAQCPGKQKCCFNGCQHVCVEALFEKGIGNNLL